MAGDASDWRSRYRVINNCIEEELVPFAPDIDGRVSIKLYFGDHRFNAYLQLEDTARDYRCRVRTLPHIYERARVVRDHLHPYFVGEARTILDALAHGKQYVPSRIDPADCLPLTREHEHAPSWTTASPRELTTSVRVRKEAPRPWPAAANAFLYAASLLNNATEGSVVDHFEKSRRLPKHWWISERPS